MLDGMTRKIVSVTNRTAASAYVLCHPTLLLPLFQKYRMEISNSIEEEIQEICNNKRRMRETKVHNTSERIIYLDKSETYIK